MADNLLLKMKYLFAEEAEMAIKYFQEAMKESLEATCQRHRCGSVIVKDGQIIGRGFNSPPYHLEEQRRCSIKKNEYHPKVTDKTCCIHAEQRAMIDALKNHPHELIDSTLYFIRVDEKGNITKAGKPYCTICSKMALDVGVGEFVLWHEDGICVYKTDEYNDLSFKYE